MQNGLEFILVMVLEELLQQFKILTISVHRVVTKWYSAMSNLVILDISYQAMEQETNIDKQLPKCLSFKFLHGSTLLFQFHFIPS